MGKKSDFSLAPILNRICHPDEVAFLTFLMSGAFIILVYAPLYLVHQFGLSLIVFIYIFPWVMLWPIYSFNVIVDKAYRVEIILIGIVLLLAGVNVVMSNDMLRSLYAMRLFLLSGIMALWASMFILADQRHKKIFYYFCCCCLLVIAIIEIYIYLTKGSNYIFIYNPIPTGTLVILLSLGPLYLLTSKSTKLETIGFLLTIFGLVLIILTQKRGTILAVSVMAISWILYRYVKRYYTIIIALFTVALLIPAGWMVYKSLDKNIPSHISILYRIEYYPFAFHIYEKHPFWGIGLQTYTHHRYLADYDQRNKKLGDFPNQVKYLQIFDNMFITAFVELGTIMTLSYLGLIFYIIIKYCRNTQPFKLHHEREFINLLPLLGIAIHSLTYDSLLWPQINWLFHVQLGILTGYAKTHATSRVA